MTSPQNPFRYAAGIRAMCRTNKLFDHPPLMLIDCYGPWLWLGWDGPFTDEELLRAKTSLAQLEGWFHVESCPPDSLAVPFRDSIRNRFSAFIRVRRHTEHV